MLIPIGTPWRYIKDLSWTSDGVLWLTVTLAQSQSAFSPGNVGFLNCPKISVSPLCWSYLAMWPRALPITIINQVDNHANQWLACNYWTRCSILVPWAFLEGDVENYWSVTRCHLKSPTPCSWNQRSYPGATWASRDHIGIMRKEQISLSVRDQGGADQAN